MSKKSNDCIVVNSQRNFTMTSIAFLDFNSKIVESNVIQSRNKLIVEELKNDRSLLVLGLALLT